MRRCLGTIVITITFLCSSLPFQVFANACTNDIAQLFDGVCSTNILGLGSRLSDICGSMDNLSDEQSRALKQYAFTRLLSLSVSTNTYGFSYVLKEKARLVENSEQILAMRLAEEDVRSILSSISVSPLISTNDLSRLREEARQRDLVLYGSRTVGASWNQRKNMAEWRRSKSLVMEWNTAIEKYRERILAYSNQLLERIWTNIPETERGGRIRSFHESYGF